MATLYEDLLNGLKPGKTHGLNDPNYLGFKKEYESQLAKYKRIIKELSGVSL